MFKAMRFRRKAMAEQAQLDALAPKVGDIAPDFENPIPMPCNTKNDSRTTITATVTKTASRKNARLIIIRIQT